MTADKVKQALKKLANQDKALILAGFFKTGVGQYGQGDKFLGITVPAQRLVAGQFKNLDLKELDKLLKSPYHEHRLTALLILVAKFETADQADKKKIVDFYLAHTKFINNWDLVDLTAPKILGAWLTTKPDDKLLNRLAISKNLWERRIAVLASFAFIKQNKFEPTLVLAKKLLKDSHDLMHKAVGWMLREIGKRDIKVLKNFLNKWASQMPRTMLRYSLEKFDEATRRYYLNKK